MPGKGEESSPVERYERKEESDSASSVPEGMGLES